MQIWEYSVYLVIEVIPQNDNQTGDHQPAALSIFHVYRTGRVRLFFISAACKLTALAVSGAANFLSSASIAGLGIAIWLAWFVLIAIIALPQSEIFLSRQRWLERAAIILTLVILITGIVWGVTVFTLHSDKNPLTRYAPETAGTLAGLFSYDDATALWQQATENLLQGKNPYTAANVVSASSGHQVSAIQITPLRRGIFADTFPYPAARDLDRLWQEAQQHPETVPVELETNYSYPAGSFLLPVPFFLAGIRDLRIISAILVMAASGIVIWRLRDRRTVFILAVLVSLELFNIIVMGDTGTLQFPFLLLGWFLWKTNWKTSALLMGLAISIKEVSWVYWLFYLILVFRDRGWARLWQVLAAGGGIFLLLNVPFAALNPGAWFSSFGAIAVDPLFPVGVGTVSLVTSGILTVSSPRLFDLTALAVLAAGLGIYWVYGRRFPYLGPVLAILPFFFSWRSLWGYFFYADIIILACILYNGYRVKA